MQSTQPPLRVLEQIKRAVKRACRTGDYQQCNQCERRRARECRSRKIEEKYAPRCLKLGDTDPRFFRKQRRGVAGPRDRPNTRSILLGMARAGTSRSTARRRSTASPRKPHAVSLDSEPVPRVHPLVPLLLRPRVPHVSRPRYRRRLLDEDRREDERHRGPAPARLAPLGTGRRWPWVRRPTRTSTARGATG